MAAVDEHGELDGLGAAEVDQLVERGAHRAAGVEHVVAKHDNAVVDRPRQMRALDLRLGGDGGQVVAIEGDVEDADGDLLPLHGLDLGGDLLGQGHAAGADAGQQEPGEIGLTLHDFPGHTPDDPRHLLGVEDRRLRLQVLGHSQAVSGRRGCYGRGGGLSIEELWYRQHAPYLFTVAQE